MFSYYECCCSHGAIIGRGIDQMNNRLLGRCCDGWCSIEFLRKVTSDCLFAFSKSYIDVASFRNAVGVLPVVPWRIHIQSIQRTLWPYTPTFKIENVALKKRLGSSNLSTEIQRERESNVYDLHGTFLNVVPSICVIVYDRIRLAKYLSMSSWIWSDPSWYPLHQCLLWLSWS